MLIKAKISKSDEIYIQLKQKETVVIRSFKLISFVNFYFLLSFYCLANLFSFYT